MLIDEWTDPETKTVYLPTRVVNEKYRISDQDLHRGTPHGFLNGGTFHKKVIDWPTRSNLRPGKLTLWPKEDVLLFVRNRDEYSARAKQQLANQFFIDLLAKGPVKARDGAQLFRHKTGLSVWSMHCARRRMNVRTSHRNGQGPPLWHLDGQDLSQTQEIVIPPANAAKAPVNRTVVVGVPPARAQQVSQTVVDAIENAGHQSWFQWWLEGDYYPEIVKRWRVAGRGSTIEVTVRKAIQRIIKGLRADQKMAIQQVRDSHLEARGRQKRAAGSSK
jgi:hypothetical protein